MYKKGVILIKCLMNNDEYLMVRKEHVEFLLKEGYIKQKTEEKVHLLEIKRPDYSSFIMD